ncbi:MAG: LPS-assembly protein LptD [Porticoccus sp.]|nr:LPS-assembly protein LptD [Porticoccus sp.]MBQ0806525.1 LPS-assembly protein LptD [Porticoccus sp.]
MPKTITHTPSGIYKAARSYHSKAILLVLFSLLIPTAVLAENTEQHSQWACQAGENGNWVCNEQAVPGKAYPRPKRSEPEFRPTDTGPQVLLAKNLDWVDEETLTPEQQKQMADGCCGTYIEPERDYPEADLEPEKASLRVASTSTEVIQENVAHLQGKVQLTQGYRQIRSDFATVNQNERTVDLEGNVQFREPGLLLTGETAHANMDTKDIQVNDATYLFHESGVRGTADRLNRPSDDIFYIDNATYTTCEPGSSAWQLVSSKVDINPETGIAHAKHVRLEVQDIPILYVPWIRFPTDDRRASGLLFPSFEVSDTNGLDFAQPIYLNLAPNYDATLTPRYLEERGTMLEVEGRHLSRRTNTIIGGAFLSSDDGGDEEDYDPSEVTSITDHEGEDRWITSIDHIGSFGRRWRTNIDYTRVSDSDYFQDIGNTTLEVNSQTHLREMASADYRTNNWKFGITGQAFQTISDNKDARDQYKLLPRVDADGAYRLGDFVFDLKNQLTSFDHSDDDKSVSTNTFLADENGTYIIGDRLRLDYAASWDKQWEWGYFRPTAKVKHLTYDLDNPVYQQNVGSPQHDDSPSVTVPVGIIDAGIYLERDTTWLNGFTQTFEPRLYMVHAKYEDQSDLPDFDTSLLTFSYNQLFRDDRFVGGDRIGDTEHVSVGLTSRLVDQTTGVEWLRASLGQIFYLDDRYINLDPNLTKSFLKAGPDDKDLTPEQREIVDGLLRNESAYAAEFSLRLSKNMRFQADVLYDDENSELDRGNTSLRYNDRENRIFNLAYRFNRKTPKDFEDTGIPTVDTDAEQGDISTVLPLFGNWSLIGRYNYDLTNSRNLETLFGLSYDSCCWRLSVLGRKWIDRNDNVILPEDDLAEDKGIFLQFQFKGLAGTGSKVETIIQDGVYGYEPPVN